MGSMPVAKIVPSEDAPQESVRYSFAAGEFELGGRKKSHETDDIALISEAAVHPFLSVEVSKVDARANDPKAVESAKIDTNPVAIESGLDQNEPIIEGGVAETLAADETSKTGKKKN